LAATTDERGFAELAGVASADLRGVRVETPEFGIQQFSSYDDQTKLDKLGLIGTGRLRGQLTGGDSKSAAGTTIDIYSSRAEPRGNVAGLQVTGFARVTLGETGRFELPAVAAGTLSFQIKSNRDSPYRMSPPRDVVIREAKESVVEIPLRRGVRVSGMVRERGAGKPIAGVSIGVISDNGSNEAFNTDERGKFEGLVIPGTLRVQVYSAPPPYITPAFVGGQQVEIVESQRDHELPPIEVTRGGSLRGTVVNDKGEPAAGATVNATWTLRDGNIASQRSTRAMSDKRGEFVLEGVAPDGELQVSASLGDASTEEPSVARASAKEAVVLRISTAANIAAAGRVIDQRGRPVGGATIEIWWQSRAPEGNVMSWGIVTFDDKRSLTADSNGTFQTPRQLKRSGEYRALVRSPGMLPGTTEWLKFADEAGAKFPDVVLGRLRTLQGRVLDSDGRPVAGATVLQSGDGPQRTQARCDEMGRFQLEGLPGTSAFVFVEKTGFRFYGQPVDATQSTLEIALRRAGEPAEHALRSLPSPFPREEALRLARQVIEPFADRVIKEGSDASKYRMLEILIGLDPARVLEIVEQDNNQDRTDFVKKNIALQLLAEDPEEARAIVESIAQPYVKQFTLTELSDHLPAYERRGKLELLEQALLNARATTDPAFRLIGLGRIGERLLDLEEVDQATRVLREGEKLAKELPPAAYAGFARGAFAEELAQIDLDAALELTKDLSDKHEYDRHHGNIAHELAAKDPAAAERVLLMVRDAYQRDQWSPRACYRMAPMELQRARQLAAAIKDAYQKAYAFGVMAQAWAPRDKGQATELLREAFDQLQQIVQSGQDRWNNAWSAVTIAAALIPVAEQIDSELVPEFVWRAISFRLPRPQAHQLAGAIEHTDGALALIVSRYDRSLARMIFNPTSAQLDTLTKNDAQFRNFGTIFAAATAIDPKHAIELMERMPDDAGLQLHTPKNSARVTVTRALTLRDDERWQALAKYLQLWIIDTEDL
jgi:hypothetical protein